MREFYSKCELGNDLEFSDEVINEMLQILIDMASDNFWKILKYGATDALVNPLYVVTQQDKFDMIKQNNIVEGKEVTKIKTKKFNYDISTDAHTEIRIFDGAWNIPTVSNYSVAIGVEIISDNSIVALDGVGKSTLNILRHEIYRIFNNAYVYKNIGKLTNVGTKGSIKLFNDSYQGYQFSLMSSSG